MKNIPVLVISILLGVLAHSGAEEPRVFESKNGQEIVAVIQAVASGQVYLQRTDGKSFTVPVDRFSPLTVEYINKWSKANPGAVPPHLQNKKPRLEIKVSTGKTNKEDNQISGFVDERKQKMAFTVTIENRDGVYPVPETKITLFVAGKSPETGKSAIVYKQVFDKVNLPLSQAVELKADPFELWYDDYGAMYGFKYKGYFLVVEDPAGKVLAEATIPSSAERYVDSILKLNAGDVYDSKYSSTGTESLSRAVKKQ